MKTDGAPVISALRFEGTYWWLYRSKEDLVDITSIDGPCTLKPPALKGAVPRERKNF